MSSLSWGCDSHKGQLMLVKRVLWVVQLGANLCWAFGLYILVVNWSWQLVWVLVSMKVLRQCLFSSARWWWWSWPIWRPRRLWYKLARYGRKKGSLGQKSCDRWCNRRLPGFPSGFLKVSMDPGWPQNMWQNPEGGHCYGATPNAWNRKTPSNLAVHGGALSVGQRSPHKN